MRVRSLVLGVAATLTVGLARAHHSFGVFDTATEQVIEGEIVEFEWTNPHTWAWINVTDPDGTVTEWGLEGMSPSVLSRRGWTRTTLMPGDHVVVTIYPLKSGQPGGTFVRATLADGTVKAMLGQTP